VTPAGADVGATCLLWVLVRDRAAVVAGLYRQLPPPTDIAPARTGSRPAGIAAPAAPVVRRLRRLRPPRSDARRGGRRCNFSSLGAGAGQDRQGRRSIPAVATARPTFAPSLPRGASRHLAVAPAQDDRDEPAPPQAVGDRDPAASGRWRVRHPSQPCRERVRRGSARSDFRKMGPAACNGVNNGSGPNDTIEHGH